VPKPPKEPKPPKPSKVKKAKEERATYKALGVLRGSRAITYGMSALFVVGAAYFFIQAMILSGAGPSKVVEDYANAVKARNGRALFDQNLFPQSGRNGYVKSDYLSWNDIDGKKWKADVSWKTNSNVAVLSLSFEGATNVEPIKVNLKATQFTKFGLFKSYENWQVISFAPVITIDTDQMNPRDDLFINGALIADVESFNVGYRGSMVVIPGKYTIELKDYKSGNIKSVTKICYEKSDCSLSNTNFS
jgi:hypothetical protein